MAFAALLLVAGCGGSSDSGAITVETGSLTKGQFTKRADALCTESKEQVFRAFSTFARNAPKSAGREEGAGAVVHGVIVPTYEGLIEHVSDLGSPEGDEEEITQFLEAIQQQLDAAEEEPSKVVNSSAIFAKAAAIARSYGLTGCAANLL